MKHQKLGGGINNDLAGIKIQQRLTRNKVVKLQDYYGRAICKHAGDVGAMTKAIWAALLHSISTDSNPQHGNCPRGQDRWCIFNKAVALLAPIPKHSISTISTWLHPKIGEIITPLYERMADENLRAPNDTAYKRWSCHSGEGLFIVCAGSRGRSRDACYSIQF